MLSGMYYCMKLVHTTTLANLRSIRKHGIRASFSRQARKAVWLHPCSKNDWAEQHVRARHEAWSEDLVHITVEIPSSWANIHSANCRYCFNDIPWDRVVKVQVVRRVLEEIAI